MRPSRIAIDRFQPKPQTTYDLELTSLHHCPRAAGLDRGLESPWGGIYSEDQTPVRCRRSATLTQHRGKPACDSTDEAIPSAAGRVTDKDGMTAGDKGPRKLGPRSSSLSRGCTMPGLDYPHWLSAAAAAPPLFPSLFLFSVWSRGVFLTTILPWSSS